MPDIIADFHGTLYKDTDEGPLWKYVAKQAIKPAEILRHPVRTAAFAIAKPVLEALAGQYERGEIGYDKIYETYNKMVLAQLPFGFVRNAIMEYASLLETRQKLDGRMLRPIKEASGRKGILSTGSELLITGVLNYDNRSLWGDFAINANPIMPENSHAQFQLYVHGNKPELIARYYFRTPGAPSLRFNPKNTVYMGDNADEEPAFEYVLERGGKVVVPFYATDDFKQHAASEYDAMIPENEQELSAFLKSL